MLLNLSLTLGFPEQTYFKAFRCTKELPKMYVLLAWHPTWQADHRSTSYSALPLSKKNVF